MGRLRYFEAIAGVLVVICGRSTRIISVICLQPATAADALTLPILIAGPLESRPPEIALERRHLISSEVKESATLP